MPPRVLTSFPSSEFSVGGRGILPDPRPPTSRDRWAPPGVQTHFENFASRSFRSCPSSGAPPPHGKRVETAGLDTARLSPSSTQTPLPDSWVSNTWSTQPGAGHHSGSKSPSCISPHCRHRGQVPESTRLGLRRYVPAPAWAYFPSEDSRRFQGAKYRNSPLPTHRKFFGSVLLYIGLRTPYLAASPRSLTRKGFRPFHG